ncbi:MAG: MerR family transcriptional regulator [Paracoccus sp. (in: a-proteobacteria)]|nr:MerR family transcriptional regulator [Paracoccus sp. (in: a-proteobacteria)]
MKKSADAFRSIGEVSQLIGVAPHVLRYWETQFPLFSPVKRRDGRRYYRPDDVRLAAGLCEVLREDGMTIRGAKKQMAADRGAALRARGAVRLGQAVEAAPEAEDQPVAKKAAAPRRRKPVADAGSLPLFPELVMDGPGEAAGAEVEDAASAEAVKEVSAGHATQLDAEAVPWGEIDDAASADANKYVLAEQSAKRSAQLEPGAVAEIAPAPQANIGETAPAATMKEVSVKQSAADHAVQLEASAGAEVVAQAALGDSAPAETMKEVSAEQSATDHAAQVDTGVVAEVEVVAQAASGNVAPTDARKGASDESGTADRETRHDVSTVDEVAAMPQAGNEDAAAADAVKEVSDARGVSDESTPRDVAAPAIVAKPAEEAHSDNRTAPDHPPAKTAPDATTHPSDWLARLRAMARLVERHPAPLPPEAASLAQGLIRARAALA